MRRSAIGVEILTSLRRGQEPPRPTNRPDGKYEASEFRRRGRVSLSPETADSRGGLISIFVRRLVSDRALGQLSSVGFRPPV